MSKFFLVSLVAGLTLGSSAFACFGGGRCGGGFNFQLAIARPPVRPCSQPIPQPLPIPVPRPCNSCPPRQNIPVQPPIPQPLPIQPQHSVQQPLPIPQIQPIPQSNCGTCGGGRQVTRIRVKQRCRRGCFGRRSVTRIRIVSRFRA